MAQTSPNNNYYNRLTSGELLSNDTTGERLASSVASHGGGLNL